jgi:uncharacterized protein DUF6714
MLATPDDRIRRVFPVAAPPSEANLALDGCSFCAAIHKALSGERWDAVSAEDLDKQVDSIALLTPDAFAYYLPAFLCRAIASPENPGVGASNVLFFTVQSLCDADLPSDAWWSERIERLSDEQRRAIAAFLHWVVQLLADEDDTPLREFAEVALERYWGQYANAG